MQLLIAQAYYLQEGYEDLKKYFDHNGRFLFAVVMTYLFLVNHGVVCWQGIYGQGKGGRKGYFSPRAGKVKGGQGSLQWLGKSNISCCRSGKIPFFLSSGKHLIFSIYIQGLFSSKFYL